MNKQMMLKKSILRKWEYKGNKNYCQMKVKGRARNCGNKICKKE
jgi:hypothetical protein